MSKIKSIRINNFKFFGKSEPIVLSGKNLLLYGENGSGKSSLYNAIYTVLEAASKDKAGVQKYFRSIDEDSESLVNIYASKDENGIMDSYLEIEDDRGKKYRLSYDETNLCKDASFRESQRASDFITYKELFYFQVFRNSEPSNLYNVFEHAVIPYLSCASYEYMGSQLSTISDLFKAYNNIDVLKDKNPKGKAVIYKKGRKYQSYLNLERKINQELGDLIDYINAQLPSILNAFGYSFNAFLRYEYLWHKKNDRWLEPHPYGVYLEIDEYDGQRVSIKHPNVFLNEAKMCALAFAIRWAILTRRPSVSVAPDALRVLVLDDLMISLDMGNRKAIVKFLFNDARAKDFQILFLTHEHILFEAMYGELGRRYGKQIGNFWEVLEMYDHEVGTKHYPTIQPYLSSYGRALAYFHGSNRPIDYMASGNALRQAVEGEFKRIFKMVHATNADGSSIAYDKLMLGGCSKIAKRIFPEHNFSLGVISELEELSWFTLNPLSHDNPYMDFYRSELQSAFKVYEWLTGILQKVLIPSGSMLSFTIECDGGVVHHYSIRLLKEFYVNIDVLSDSYELLDKALEIEISEEGGMPHQVKHTSFTKIYRETIEFLERKKLSPVDESASIYREILLNGKTIEQLVHELIEHERMH